MSRQRLEGNFAFEDSLNSYKPGLFCCTLQRRSPFCLIDGLSKMWLRDDWKSDILCPLQCWTQRGWIGVLIQVMSVIGYLGMLAGAVGLIAVGGLFSLSPLVVLAQIAAIMLWVWARLTFGPRSFYLAANPIRAGLVTSGPYHFIRHPVYAAVCLFVWAGALAPHSLTALLLAALVTAGTLLRIFCEERLLVERLPEYRQYAASTKRLIPCLL